MGKEIKLNEKIWEEFRKKKAVINCRTKEEAENLMKLLDKKDYIWGSGTEDINEIGTRLWDREKVDTCYKAYKNSIGYCYSNYYIREGYKVYTYKELITPDKTPNIVTNIKHIKNGRATIVEINGKKGIAKCHEEEIHNQDDIVGFTLAYCRAMGITVEDLIHRLEKSGVVEKEDQKQEIKTVDGHLVIEQKKYEVGDMIVYTNMFPSSGIMGYSNTKPQYKIGKITNKLDWGTKLTYWGNPYIVDGMQLGLFDKIEGRVIESNSFKNVSTDELLKELKRRTEKQVS